MVDHQRTRAIGEPHVVGSETLRRVPEGREHTPLNTIRLAAGGALPNIGHDDALVAGRTVARPRRAAVLPVFSPEISGIHRV